MTSIIYYGLATALTVILTAITYRLQIARKKQPSSGAMLVGALSASAIATIFTIFYFAGESVYSLDFWRNPETPGVWDYLLQWASSGLVCFFPAAIVVSIFQRKIRQ